MKTLLGSKITAKELNKNSVLVPYTLVSLNKQGEVYGTSFLVVDTCKAGYRVGLKNRVTGKIEEVELFKTMATLKVRVSGSWTVNH